MVIAGWIHVLDRHKAGALRGLMLLEDVSEADAPSHVIAAAPLTLADGIAQAQFRLKLDAAPDPMRHYAVTARLEGEEKATGRVLVFGTTTAYPWTRASDREIVVEVGPWT
jgi:uncharacterized lipoprotein YbaY